MGTGERTGVARRYAELRSEWTSDDWWMLEEAAFSSESAARMEILADAPAHIWRKVPRRGGRSRALLALRAIHWLVEVVGPLVGGAVLLGWALRGSEPPAPVGVAGILAAAGALAGILTLWLQRRDPERGGSGARILMALHLVPSAAAAAIAVSAMAAMPVEGALGLAGIVLDLAVGLCWSGLVVRAARGASSRASTAPRALERLAPAKRSAIASDLAEAVRVLERKGLIDARDAATARDARLGRLGAALGTPKRPRTDAR